MADPSSGGAILGEACHFADLLYWLLDSEPVAVTAFSLPTGKSDTIGENNLASTILFADGSIANFTYCTVGSATSAGERVEVFAPGMGLVCEDFKKFTAQAGMRSAKSSLVRREGLSGAGPKLPRRDPPGQGAAGDCARWRTLDPGLPGDCWNRPARRAPAALTWTPRCASHEGLAKLGPYPPPHGGVQTNLVAITRVPATPRHSLRGDQSHALSQARRG